MLRTRVPTLDQKTGELIVEELGRLPLALEQAAAYLDRTQLPARGTWICCGPARRRYRRGSARRPAGHIATLWDISLERISVQNPAAVQLLDVCAYLAPRPAPLDLFTAHPGQLPEPLSSAAADNLALAATVAVAARTILKSRGPPPGCNCTGSSRPLSAPATSGS